MNTGPEKFDLNSHNIAQDKLEELLQRFPEIRTEGGKIDFEKLRLILGENVDVGRERYGMNWPGKADCFKTIQMPSLGTLLPCPEESIDFDTTENMIIEGDNLEVLKLLQKSYLGKIKMIYIDPPYNSGNDFIYPDNYAESLETYLEYTGQVDSEGKKFGTNSDTDGRFHSKWMNMMYTRIYLSRNLLRDDGVIFISIDDKEVHNLRRLCDEVFGEENRIGLICWKNVTDNNPTLITSDNEFIICYARSKDRQPKEWKSRFSTAKELLQDEYERLKNDGLSMAAIQSQIREFISDNEESVGFLSRYKHVDEKGIFTGSESVHNPRPGGYNFEVLHPTTGKPMRKPANGYRFPEKTFRDMEAEGIIIYGDDENRIVKIKKYLIDYEDSLRSVITLDGRLGSYELKRLFPEYDTIFTNPKPTELLESLISFTTDKNDIVLDFFAGSGSVAQSVLELNEKDKSDLKFILVQLPEPTRTQKNDGTWDESSAWKAGLYTIAEICKERVRRIIKNISKALQGNLSFEDIHKRDTGFRVFKLAESNFKVWDASAARDIGSLEKQLEMHIYHVLDGRSDTDILYELILKSGFLLTTPIERLILEGKVVYSIQSGALIICLERPLTTELIRAMVEKKPERVVCLDQGFASNDQLKTNAVQMFKSKGITFRTV